MPKSQRNGAVPMTRRRRTPDHAATEAPATVPRYDRHGWPKNESHVPEAPRQTCSCPRTVPEWHPQATRRGALAVMPRRIRQGMASSRGAPALSVITPAARSPSAMTALREDSAGADGRAADPAISRPSGRKAVRALEAAALKAGRIAVQNWSRGVRQPRGVLPHHVPPHQGEASRRDGPAGSGGWRDAS